MEERQNENAQNIFSRSLLTGFVGGVLSSLFALFLYIFNFTEVAPKSYLLKPWVQNAWTDEWQGHLIATILAGVVSLLVAIIYYFLFRKINSLWVGVLLGIVLWGFLFLIVHPLLPHTKTFSDLSMDTLITTGCIFILYGCFIGYSISYDYHSVKINIEKQKSK